MFCACLLLQFVTSYSSSSWGVPDPLAAAVSALRRQCIGNLHQSTQISQKSNQTAPNPNQTAAATVSSITSCCLCLTAAFRARADRPILLPEHSKRWASEWLEGSVRVAGNQKLSRAINSSLYYLMSSSSPELPLSLSPGGLASNGVIHSILNPRLFVTLSTQATTATHSGTANPGCSRHFSLYSPGRRCSCSSMPPSAFLSAL
jgi:hypothetical protein